MSVQTAGNATPLELEDMQALLRFGFKHLTHASFLLLRIKNRDAARAWLAAAPVTSAVTAKPLPTTALQVALTSDGLRALEVAPDIIEGFANEYVAGMSSDSDRSQRLGDVADSDPSQWLWGVKHQVPHVLVMLYAAPGLLHDFQQSIKTQLGAGFGEPRCLMTSELGSTEPFGFEDGISQPKLDWDRERPVCDEEQYAYTNLACLGEFLLGYPNEYGGYTDRPLLDPQRSGAAILPRAEDAPDKVDLGRNGSYLVLRQLKQDVHGFWRYVDQQAAGDAAMRERLAAAMVGRARDGEPLVGRTNEVIAGNATKPEDDINAFTYQSDPKGLRCPLGAHVRRSNPRNADLPPGKLNCISRLIRTLGFDAEALDNDLVASTRFHRLLRRGRKYGDPISPEQALAGTSVGSESGLHFICLGANIARQFEFVQGSWIVGTKFAGLPGEGDPLLGHRQPGPDGSPTNVYLIPQPNGADRRLTALPSFVTVRGGAYFFLPGIRALRYLATVR
jgi:deferrochelatase/peroxidase EfeB